MPSDLTSSNDSVQRRRISVQDNLDPIVVGIDIGLTYTGVAFSTLDMEKPRVIQRWPGSADQITRKVPTQLCYRAGNRTITSWGYSCPSPGNVEPGMRILDRFKLYLDERFLEDTFQGRPNYRVGTHEDVKMWYLDFLTEIYDYSTKYICAELGLSHWESKPVQFTFSVPTIWDDSVIELFEKLVRDAGFGKPPRHSVTIDLSEAEAAAVYTMKSLDYHRTVTSIWDDLDLAFEASIERPHLEEGDVILVCDSGGGTTDISILQVKLKTLKDHNGDIEEIAELKRLDSIDYFHSVSSAAPNSRPRPCSVPQAIGSVQIDEAFQQEVLRRLNLIRRDEFPNIRKIHVAEQMSKGGHFQSIKERFGTSMLRDWREFRIPVPGLPDDYNNTDAKIRNGGMIFVMEEIQRIFDIQVDRIFRAINEQLTFFEDLMPSKQVSHFVLSGGLGSSKYVQDCILKYYGSMGGGKQILISDKPQLAVCQGLVIDLIHRLKYSESILSTRCCRFSYGILFHEPYNNRNHTSWKIPLFRNPINGNKYAVDQIYWLVLRGKPIKRNEPICRKFYRMVDVKNPETNWKDIIAMSRTRIDRLPTNLHEDDAERIGNIVSKLGLRYLTEGQAGVEKKAKRGLGLKVKEHWKVTLEVRVYIGLASLRFEIWFAGEPIGKHEGIHVGWLYPEDENGQDQELGEEESATQFQGLLVDD